MSPPISGAIIASRPLLDPHPDTVVGPLILSTAVFHRCRISDYLYLVFQWGLHVGIFARIGLAKMQSVYTAEGNPRLIRKHEGRPARAPDGTIIEIGGQPCPGNTGEPVGPWDFGNVKECVGYLDWRAGLERTMKDALNQGLEPGEVNMPVPSREKLESANAVEVKWQHGKPLGTAARKRLASERDGIREKVEGFLVFVDKEVKSEKGRQMVYDTLRNGFRMVMDGEKSREFEGVLGCIINKILERVEAFLSYLHKKIEAEPVRQQRAEEISEIMERVLQGKGKRNLEGSEVESEILQKRIKVSASEDSRSEITTKSAGPLSLTSTPKSDASLRGSGVRESPPVTCADDRCEQQLLMSTPTQVSMPAKPAVVGEARGNKNRQRVADQYFAANEPKNILAKPYDWPGIISNAEFKDRERSWRGQVASQLPISAASTKSAMEILPSLIKLTAEPASINQRYQSAALRSLFTEETGSRLDTFHSAVTSQSLHAYTSTDADADAEVEAEDEDDVKVKQEDLSVEEEIVQLHASVANFYSPLSSPSPVPAVVSRSPLLSPAPCPGSNRPATPANHDDEAQHYLQKFADDQEQCEEREGEGQQASREASESLFLPIDIKSEALTNPPALCHPTMRSDVIKIEDDDDDDEIQIISPREWARSRSRKWVGTLPAGV